MTSSPDGPARVRLDVWLDVACLFRTRSAAQQACKGGKVEVDGQRSKPHRELRGGEEILITRPLGRRQKVVVRQMADRHLPKAEARRLFDDLTPPPGPEEVELRRLSRLAGPASRASRAPSKRDRRALRALKERR